MEGSAWAGRRRAVLWPVDARQGPAANRASVPESERDDGDGAGASRPEAICGPGADGDRVAVGADGAESESGLCGCGGAAGVDLYVVD